MRALPYVLFAYPLLALMAGRSEVPAVLGRYSLSLAVMIAACVAIYVLGLTAARRGRHGLGQAALVALAAASLLVTASSTVVRLPMVELVLPAVRLACAAALLTGAARAAGARRSGGGWLAVAAVLALTAVADMALAALARGRPVHALAGEGAFRQPQDLAAIDPGGIVLLGDSFVWGQGVRAEEAFGARLEQLTRERGRPRRVYSLGVVGGNLESYVRVARRLPPERKVAQVVVACYLNDMPPRPRWSESVRNQSIALGTSAPTLRLVGDALARTATPTLEDYHASVVQDYDPAHPTFRARWALLESRLRELHGLARERGRAPPLLLILPLMVDFRAYPLESAHAALAGLARGQGYAVLDLLPVFRQRLGDGTAFRASPGDNHFDARTHALVAEVLLRALDESGAD